MAAICLLGGAAEACETCRPSVRAAVYDAQFGPRLALLLVPLGLVAAIGFGIERWERSR